MRGITASQAITIIVALFVHGLGVSVSSEIAEVGLRLAVSALAGAVFGLALVSVITQRHRASNRSTMTAPQRVGVIAGAMVYAMGFSLSLGITVVGLRIAVAALSGGVLGLSLVIAQSRGSDSPPASD